jgi:hypothetical protein
VDKQMLEAARRAYLERPVRPVLQVLAEAGGRKAVVLGDPGSGKSTLARYLVLAHASALLGRDEQPVDAPAGQAGQGGGWVPAPGWLPLLVELRTFADSRWSERTFLDLIGPARHRGAGAAPGDAGGVPAQRRPR